MPTQQQIQVQLDPNGYYITGVNMAISDEEFFFFITSQNQARQYVSSPKHAKRISLLLQKFISEYEAKNGTIQTELPKVPDQTTESNMGFTENKKQ